MCFPALCVFHMLSNLFLIDTSQRRHSSHFIYKTAFMSQCGSKAVVQESFLGFCVHYYSFVNRLCRILEELDIEVLQIPVWLLATAIT